MRRLEVFGSAARGEDFDPARSDVDFLVDFDRDNPAASAFDAYFGLKESLEALLGRTVDLVEMGAVRWPTRSCRSWKWCFPASRTSAAFSIRCAISS